MTFTSHTDHDQQATRRDVRRLLGLGSVIILIVLLGCAAMLAFACVEVDKVQAREERFLVRHTLTRFQDRLTRDITTVSVWDQAYEELLPGGDVAWADAEIGTYFANNRGHDLTLVLDSHDRAFYAFHRGQRARPAELAGFRADLEPMLEALRAKERSAPPPGRNHQPTAPELATTISGVMKSGGAYYFVGASTVTPEQWNAPRRPGPAVVVFSAQRVDGPFLTSLDREINVRGAVLGPVTAKRQHTVRLKDHAGRPVAQLTLAPKRPSVQVLSAAAPAIAFGLLALLLTSVALALRIHRIVERLYRNHEELDLAFAQVVDARDAAEAANRAKSDFLANMSHEIRTPLNGLLGMAQVMQRGELAPDQAQRLKIVRDSGATLLRVLNDILDLSKIEAGHLELEFTDFDLKHEVSAVCGPFADLARHKGLTFSVSVDPQAEGLWRGDELRIRQVLGNLVSNAVKFTAAGSVGVRVEVAGEGVSFAVTDTGVGVPAEMLPRLFEKFVQADSSTTRQFGGSGLGLAICRELVEAMGGRLVATSAEAMGSTFRFVLPLERASDQDAASAAAPEEAAGPLAARILAADDNRTNQNLLQALLEPFCVELTQVNDGYAAVEAWQAGDFDLVLMDIQMPGMDGIDAARAIRAQETASGRRRVPILALSANVMPHQVQEYFAAGMDGFIAKPIDAADLIRTVADTLAAAGSGPDETLAAAG